MPRIYPVLSPVNYTAMPIKLKCEKEYGAYHGKTKLSAGFCCLSFFFLD